MMNYRWAIGVGVLGTLMAGCGGSSGGSGGSVKPSTFDLTIEWPDGRANPADYQSVVVRVERAAAQGDPQLIEERVVTKGATPATTVGFDLPAGTGYHLTMAAHPNADGSGDALAAGHADLDVVTEAKSTLVLDTDGVANSISVIPVVEMVATGNKLRVEASAVTTEGKIVLLQSDRMTWSSDNPGDLTVHPGSEFGKTNDLADLEGISVGSAKVTLADSASGKTYEATIEVEGDGSGTFQTYSYVQRDEDFPPFGTITGISPDGKYVLGSSNWYDYENRKTDYQAMKWDKAGAFVPVGPGLPLDSSTNATVTFGHEQDPGYYTHAWIYPGDRLPTLGGRRSWASACTPDGTKFVGYANIPAGRRWGYVWTPSGGMVGFGDPSDAHTLATAISDDGNVIAGYVNPFNTYDELPFLRTDAGGMRMVNSNLKVGGPVGLSHDGRVMATRYGYRWTEATGYQSIGSLGGETFAVGMSSSGNVIVGMSGGLPFRWTAATGMKQLNVPGAKVKAVSNDGTVVVGELSDDGSRFFRWELNQ